MSQQLTIQIDRLSKNQQTAEKWADELVDAEYGFCALVEDSIHYDAARKKVSFQVRRPLWELPLEQIQKVPFPFWLFSGRCRVPCVVSLVEIAPVEKFERVKWSSCPGLDVVFEDGGLSIGEGDFATGFFVGITEETKLLMQNAGKNNPDHTYTFSEGQIKKKRQWMESMVPHR